MLGTIIGIAAAAHSGQFDKGGRPYILHCLSVMNLLGPDADEELQCIAIGHDLFEDTKVTMVDLTEAGISQRVIHGILTLTKMPGQSFHEYKVKVMGNPDAIKVKMADLTHNSDIRRLKGVTQKDFDRVVKYMQFYDELKSL